MKKNIFLISTIFILMIGIIFTIGLNLKIYAEPTKDYPKLKEFNIVTKQLSENEKIYYTIDYEYNGEVKYIGLWAKEVETNETFYISTQHLNNGYFDLGNPSGNTAEGTGTFEVTGLTFGLEEGIYYYSENEVNSENSKKYDFKNQTFTIKKNYPKLKEFSIVTKQLSEGEKLHYTIDYEYDGEVMFIGLWAKEVETNKPFYISTQYLNNGYFDLGNPSGNTAEGTGTFEVTGLTFGIDGGIYYYSKDDVNNENSEKYDFKNQTFIIKESKSNVGIFDYVMTMKTKKASVGEKAYLSFGSPESFNGEKINPKELSNVLLSFIDENDNSVMNVYIKSLNDEPYFIIPSNIKGGRYNLDYGYLTFVDGTSEKYKNNGSKVFCYEGTIDIIEKEIDTTTYVFNNENYNENVVNDLEKLDNDAIITVNANKLPIIDANIFKSIQSTNRTLIIEYENNKWIFNGKDITTPKSIEASIVIEDLLTSEDYDDFLKNKIKDKSVLLKFNKNGELPGKVLISIDDEEISKYIDEEVLYVYYYDEDEDKLTKVAMEIQKNNGFYEFYINHNSKYIISSQEISEDLLLETETNTDKDENNHDVQNVKVEKIDNIKIIISVFAVVMLILAIILISFVMFVIYKRKKNKREE